MLNFTCNYWQESCTLARLWICHLFVNSTQKIQTEINKRAWLAPDIRTLAPSGCMCLPRLLYPPRMPDKSDCHHLPRLSCMQLQLCACPPTPYGAAHFTSFCVARPCMQMQVGTTHSRAPHIVASLASLLCCAPMDVHAGGDQIYICNIRCNIQETYETYI